MTDTTIAATRGSMARPSTRIVGLRLAAAIFLLVAVAARWQVFGDPVVQIDEQFYLLVGGRMLHGAIPYVDIWDRKPIGLFLLYAAFRAPGGSGVLAYQIGGLLSVWGTALLLFAMARRVSPPSGALAAGLLYIFWLNLAGGEAGQAPVFYNLPVAGAIALVFFRRHLAIERQGDLRLTGMGAMLLFGIAMQIKYSAVFEGVFAGLMLIGLAWHGGRRPAALVSDMLLWVGCALLPTVLAAGAYAAMGHLGDWWFANATSILTRGSERPDTMAGRIQVMSYLLLPLLLCLPLRRWLDARPQGEEARADMRFLDGWAASALLGVVLFGTWYNHYALPLFAPFAVTAAPLWRSLAGRGWLLLLLFASGIWGQHALWRHGITRGTGHVLAEAAAATRGHRGCIFVYDGYPALYDATNSCLPTTRAFPSHLQALNERGATGIDEVTEVKRIMAGRPDRVMTMEPAYDEENLAARAEVYGVLGPHYRELYRYNGGSHEFVVYGLEGTVLPGRPIVEGREQRFGNGGLSLLRR